MRKIWRIQKNEGANFGELVNWAHSKKWIREFWRIQNIECPNSGAIEKMSQMTIKESTDSEKSSFDDELDDM